MDDDVFIDGVGERNPKVVERSVLAETPEGREIASAFVATVGEFVAERVRPVLQQVDAQGGEPQLLVNGLAELMRSVADSIEFAPGERGNQSFADPGPRAD